MMLAAADLVLTMTDDQRTWAVESCPRALRTTFGVTQFAHLVSAVAPTPMNASDGIGPALLVRAQAARSRVQPLAEGRDIADPIGHGISRFRSCGHTLQGAIDAMFSLDRSEG
jgi:protein-tyrosine-phosphatase